MRTTCCDIPGKSKRLSPLLLLLPFIEISGRRPVGRSVDGLATLIGTPDAPSSFSRKPTIRRQEQESRSEQQDLDQSRECHQALPFAPLILSPFALSLSLSLSVGLAELESRRRRLWLLAAAADAARFTLCLPLGQFLIFRLVSHHGRNSHFLGRSPALYLIDELNCSQLDLIGTQPSLPFQTRCCWTARHRKKRKED